MAHDAELQRFIGGGETRQLYALDQRSGRIVYINDGQAEALRPDCRAGHLICPIEGCESRAFTTYGGTQKRHHFKHLHRGAAAHGPESYYHQLGKALLGQRIRDRHPEAGVIVDQEALDHGQRPDVLVAFPDGRRFAFELQYSPLSLAEFERRHRGYVAQNVTDIWLLGHLPPHLRPSRTASFAIDLGPLAQAIRTAGQPIRFFSPDERKIATVLSESGRFSHFSHVGELAYDDLEPCELRGEALWVPTDDVELAASIARAAEAETRRQQQEAAAARAERAAAAAKQWEIEHRRGRRKREQAWRVAEPKARACFGLDELPPIITDARPSDWGVEWHPAHWHARFFWKHIEGKLGETFSYSDAIRDFYREQPYGKESARRAVGAYLFRLRRSGYLLFDADGYWIESDILVVAGISNPPTNELAHELLRGQLLLDGDDVVFAVDGRVLRRLRARRDGDDFPSLAVLLEQAERQRNALAREAYENDPRQRMGGRELVIEASPARVDVLLYDDLWASPFQAELRRLAALHPGEARLEVTIYPRRFGPIREVTLVGITPDEAFCAALEAARYAYARAA